MARETIMSADFEPFKGNRQAIFSKIKLPVLPASQANSPPQNKRRESAPNMKDSVCESFNINPNMIGPKTINHHGPIYAHKKAMRIATSKNIRYLVNFMVIILRVEYDGLFNFCTVGFGCFHEPKLEIAT